MLHDFGEILNRDFFRVANIDHFAHCAVQGHQAEQRFHGVPDVAEAAGLLAIAVNFDGFSIERPLHEVRENHPIAPGLPRAHRVEKTNDDYRLLLFFPVGKSQKLVERLGCGIAPAPLRGGAEH